MMPPTSEVPTGGGVFTFYSGESHNVPNRHRPDAGPDDHRQEYRRDEDQLNASIADRVVSEPVVKSIFATGKLLAALMVIGTFAGSIIGATGGRWIGNRQEVARLDAKIDTAVMRAAADTKRVEVMTQSLIEHVARTDSVLMLVRVDASMSSFVTCLMVRRLAPDLRPKDCDAAERRGRGP